jgi:hypothetical protein
MKKKQNHIMKDLFKLGAIGGVLYLLRNVFKIIGLVIIFAILYYLSTII